MKHIRYDSATRHPCRSGASSVRETDVAVDHQDRDWPGTGSIRTASFSLSRRVALRAVGAAGLGVGTIFCGRTTFSQEPLPQLTEDNPRAVALQYTSNAAAPDLLLPARGEGEFCRNCRFFKGEAGQAEGWAGCEIFPEFRVSAAGWCNTWTERPA